MNSKSTWMAGIAVLLVVLCTMFWKSFQPAYVHFSNDGPLGVVSTEQLKLPDSLFGIWQDTNWVGGWNGNFSPIPTTVFLWALGPVYFAKFYQFLSCLFLGVSMWFCLRRLNLHPAVAVIGGLAAALNGDFFSYACWGLGSLTLSVAFFVLAIGAIGDGSGKHLLVRLVLAGFAIGMSVMEGFDNGAIFSLFLSAYVVWTFVIQGEKGMAVRLSKGVGAVALVAVCAGVMASSAMLGLISTQVKGVALFDESAQSPEQKQMAEQAQWEFATQWSLPKMETVRLLIPGVYGYRMDAPNGAQYWGTVGSAHAWDDYLAQSKPNPANAPRALIRFSGAGFYAGVPVCLIALWALFRSFSSKQDAFTPVERKIVWFWALMAFLSLLLSWGRHAPFYQLFYELPYFSSIRNPIKFLHTLSFSLVFLFALGLQGMWRSYLEGKADGSATFKERVGKWWKSAGAFDRRWVIGSAIFLAACLWGALVFSGSRASTVSYLELVGFPNQPGLPADQQTAHMIFSSSVSEVFWGIFFVAATAAAIGLFVIGFFRGPQHRWGLVVIGGILVFDLMRANLPWVVHYQYQDRYATKPLYETLSTDAHEHRVSAALPLIQSQLSWGAPRLQDQQTASSLMQLVQNFVQVYGVEWKQHQFPYFNIQTLDIVQEPRASVENTQYRNAFPQNNPRLYLRMLRLTNTRYLLALDDPFLTPLNELKGDAPGEFRSIMNLGMEQAGEFVRPTESTNSPLALVEYTGVLPRAKLYSNWEIIEDPEAALNRLANLEFDPAASVIISSSVESPDPSAGDPGTVVFESYAPKHIRLKANALTRSALLLNDKFDPNWQVLVDGEPAELLKANFLMRGVLLEPGEHTVEFHFRPPASGLYITLLAIVAGGGLCGWLTLGRRRELQGQSSK